MMAIVPFRYAPAGHTINDIFAKSLEDPGFPLPSNKDFHSVKDFHLIKEK